MYSKSEIVKAGDNIRKGKATQVDFDKINYWRSEHLYALNTFKNIIDRRLTVNYKNVKFARRLKRLNTIVDKISNRHQGMKITRMQDVAGCRLIFDNLRELRRFEKKLNITGHELIRVEDKIKDPESTGYRSLHHVYKFKSDDAFHNGMLLELQLRTKAQHYWATTVEIFDQIEKKRLKFSDFSDSKQVAEFYKLSAEIIARSKNEGIDSKINLKNMTLLLNTLKLMFKANIIGFYNKISLLKTIQEDIVHNNIIIRIPYGSNKTQIIQSDDENEIKTKYFELEKEHPEDNIVYVLGIDEDIKESFRNYFYDNNGLFFRELLRAVQILITLELDKYNIFTKILIIIISAITYILLNIYSFIYKILQRIKVLIGKFFRKIFCKKAK